MTNKEKYKRAFSVLHASENHILEAGNMEKKKNAYIKRIVAASTAIVAASFSLTAAYAADVGGIQEKLTMWFHGEETEVTAENYGENSYKYTFTDSEGNPQEFVAGGVTIDDSGREHAVSAKEVLEDLSDSVSYTDTGRFMLFYYDKQQKIDITDMIDEEGVCRVAVKDGKKTVYFKIEFEGEENTGLEKTTEVPKDAERYTIVE